MFRILQAMENRAEYLNKLAAHERKYPDALTQGKTECVKCGTCCLRRPADITPDELKTLAQHFNKTPSKFFQEYCVVDGFGEDMANGLYLVMFRRYHQKGNHFITCAETYAIESPCVFSQNGCLIHEWKPNTCKIQNCWKDEDEQTDLSTEPFNQSYKWNKKELLALGYTGAWEE